MIFVVVNMDQIRDLQIFSLKFSQLSYSSNVVLSNLILELLISISYHICLCQKLNVVVNIMHPVNIVLWCPSCWFEITNNYSIFLEVFQCWLDSYSWIIFRTCYIQMTLFSLKYISISILVDIWANWQTNSCCFLFTPIFYLSIIHKLDIT